MDKPVFINPVFNENIIFIVTDKNWISDCLLRICCELVMDLWVTQITSGALMLKIVVSC